MKKHKQHYCKNISCGRLLNRYDIFNSGRICYYCLSSSSSILVRPEDLEEGDIFRKAGSTNLYRVYLKLPEAIMYSPKLSKALVLRRLSTSSQEKIGLVRSREKIS